MMSTTLIAAIALVVLGAVLLAIARGRRSFRSLGVAAILIGIVLALSLLYTNAAAPRIG